MIEELNLRQRWENWVETNCREVSFAVYNNSQFSIIIQGKRYLVIKANIPEEFIGEAM